MLGALSGFNYSQRFSTVGPKNISHFIEERPVVSIYGEVANWPDLKKDRCEIEISLDSIAGEYVREVEGSILLKVTDTTSILQLGDKVEFRTRIYPLPPTAESGQFDYRKFLMRKGIFGLAYLPTYLNVRVDKRVDLGLWSVVDNLRKSIVNALDSNLTPTASALAKGFLIGETRSIPPSIYRMFRDSGTMHLLAVSGSNVALVVAFMLILLRPFPIKVTSRRLILISTILIFMFLSYGEPSVVRAAIMATLVIVARFIGRRIDLNQIIALTALIILLYNPAQLFDVGFQLSFVTAWGLIFTVPRITEAMPDLFKRSKYRYILLPLVVSLVAQLFSTPVVVFYFGRMPVLSIIANLIIVPLVSIAVIGIMAVLSVHLIWPLLGKLAGSLVSPILDLVVFILDMMGGENIPVIDFGSLSGEPLALIGVLLIYAIILMAIISINSIRTRQLTLLATVGSVALMLVLLLFNSSDNQRTSLRISELAGGVAVVVTYGDSPDANLILVGVRDKKYPLDSTVMVSLKQGAGIERFRTIFVNGADYGSTKEIIRMSLADSVIEIYFHEKMRSLVTDAVTSNPLIHKDQIKFFSEQSINRSEIGYQCDRRGLWLITDSRAWLFTTDIKAEHFESEPMNQATTLLIGKLWRPTAQDRFRLEDAGYNSFICSKIEQARETTSEQSGYKIDHSLPENYISLKSSTSVLIYTDIK